MYLVLYAYLVACGGLILLAQRYFCSIVVLYYVVRFSPISYWSTQHSVLSTNTLLVVGVRTQTTVRGNCWRYEVPFGNLYMIVFKGGHAKTPIFLVIFNNTQENLISLKRFSESSKPLIAEKTPDQLNLNHTHNSLEFCKNTFISTCQPMVYAFRFPP
jgi:hypothetical protein